MSGMITTGTSSLSDYNSRSVVIEVAGLCRQDIMRTSNYTVKVPYSRMSKTMQGVMRMGGKVVGVKMASDAPPNEEQ
ncbi:MAG: rod-capping linker protein [Symploca sp. SIO3C6]|nr:rod-capping linker protein [Symploca sp. SIO3C6]